MSRRRVGELCPEAERLHSAGKLRQPGPKPGKDGNISLVWNYFRIYDTDRGMNAIALGCGATYALDISMSTANLKRHIQHCAQCADFVGTDKHQDFLMFMSPAAKQKRRREREAKQISRKKLLVDAKQSAITSVLRGMGTDKALHTRIVSWAMRHGIPFRALLDPTFRDALREMCERVDRDGMQSFRPLTRTSLSAAERIVAQDNIELIRQKFSAAPLALINVSADGWRDAAKRRYIGVNGFSVGSQGEFISAPVDLVPVMGMTLHWTGFPRHCRFAVPRSDVCR
jgi:hypothetical protein